MGTLQNPSSFFGGGQIGGDVKLEGSFELGLGRSLSYSEDAGDQTLVDVPVSGDPAAGTSQSYPFDIDGTSILEVNAEADGAGGLQNINVRVPSDFIVDGDTTQVDNVLTGDIELQDGGGTTQLRFDATAAPPLFDFRGKLSTHKME